MWRRLVLVVVGAALILDGLAGWSTDVVAVVVGLGLIGGVSLDGLLGALGNATDRRPGPPR